jgi:galacturan 1,4-alpha-galacturonidase
MRLLITYTVALLNAVCCLTLESQKRCAVIRSSDGSDDTPSILQAFKDCRQDGTIIFDNGTYHVNSVMNITSLRNVRIELNGKLLVSKVTP